MREDKSVKTKAMAFRLLIPILVITIETLATYLFRVKPAGLASYCFIALLFLWSAIPNNLMQYAALGVFGPWLCVVILSIAFGWAGEWLILIYDSVLVTAFITVSMGCKKFAKITQEPEKKDYVQKYTSTTMNLCSVTMYISLVASSLVTFVYAIRNEVTGMTVFVCVGILWCMFGVNRINKDTLNQV